ncbi:hypothetical protein [Brevundimonas sp. GCM10030266]|uniref:hypothetical protein n=1 Tax=Brevundimonas sp. GCM10030266 TaxID=3273386 RepID=UPI00361F00D1
MIDWQEPPSGYERFVEANGPDAAVPIIFGDAPYIISPHSAERFGRVEMECMAHDDHSLTDCRPLAEMPQGRGLGEYAVREAHRVGRTPQWLEGGRRYKVMLFFKDPNQGD